MLSHGAADLNMYSADDLSAILGNDEKRPSRMQSENTSVCMFVYVMQPCHAV